jgi:hypothetical protein
MSSVPSWWSYNLRVDVAPYLDSLPAALRKLRLREKISLHLSQLLSQRLRSQSRFDMET